MKKILIPFVALIILFLSSCRKYLEKKPDVKLAIPTSLADFQALMDDNIIVENSTPGVSDLGTDDYYLTDQAFAGLDDIPKNCYIWEPDIYEGRLAVDWEIPYRYIYVANVVLEGLREFSARDAAEQTIKNQIYGHALFIRATMHYWLEETFGQPYKPASASSDLGIPLKLTANLAQMPVRTTTQQVYAQIVNDLEEAAKLLPDIAVAKNRPSKAAAFAMLARSYLVMQQYDKALISADSSLQINSTLIDYNPLSGNNPFINYAPPSDNNFESLHYTTQISYGVIRQSNTTIDTNLYLSYNNNDMRKSIFFRASPAVLGKFYFKGNYSGTGVRQFSGPAVDEVLLIRAECYARAGNKDAALLDIDKLMIKRWKNNGTFSPMTAVDAEDALKKVLTERRKELIFRGIRWTDLRRLNQDPRFAVPLTRILNGQTYTLLPNDNRYTYPIPENEIQLGGLQQNPR